MTKKKPNKATREELQQIGCYIWHHFPEYRKECEYGFIHIVVGHHLIGNQTTKGMSLKADDKDRAAICVNHHTGKYGIHQIGVETWEKKYTSQVIMNEWTNIKMERLGL